MSIMSRRVSNQKPHQRIQIEDPLARNVSKWGIQLLYVWPTKNAPYARTVSDGTRKRYVGRWSKYPDKAPQYIKDAKAAASVNTVKKDDNLMDQLEDDASDSDKEKRNARTVKKKKKDSIQACSARKSTRKDDIKTKEDSTEDDDEVIMSSTKQQRDIRTQLTPHLTQNRRFTQYSWAATVMGSKKGSGGKLARRSTHASSSLTLAVRLT